jgi:hypothetical protein
MQLLVQAGIWHKTYKRRGKTTCDIALIALHMAGSRRGGVSVNWRRLYTVPGFVSFKVHGVGFDCIRSGNRT